MTSPSQLPPASPSGVPLLRANRPSWMPGTPATGSSDESPPPTPTTPAPQPSEKTIAKDKPKDTMDGALPSLLWGAFAPCVPVAIVSSVLLTAILHNRIDKAFVSIPHNQQPSSNSTTLSLFDGVQQIEANGGGSAYFLYYNSLTNPAVLHTISSWTAKIMPFLTGASMALVAFFAGQRILRATNSKAEKLPSPHQVSILISLLNGGGSQPLLDTIKYRFQHHEPLVQPLPLAFWSLSFIVFITFAIGAADSWFGAATTAMNIALIVPQANISSSYGKTLSPAQCGQEQWQLRACPSDAQVNCSYPCNVAPWTASDQMREGVYDAQEAAKTLMSKPSRSTTFNATVNGTNYFFLGDPQSGTTLDFVAKTLAIQTQCQMVTPQCEISSDINDPGFSCTPYSAPSFSYSGEVGVDPANATSSYHEAAVGIQFFDDASWNLPIGMGANATTLFGARNPLHFLVWSKGYPPVDTQNSEAYHEMRNSGLLSYDATGDPVFILDCSASVHDTMYTWYNGAAWLNQTGDLALASGYHGAVFSAPFAISSALSNLALQDAAALAAYETTEANLTRVFTDYFSKAAVALSAGISEPRPNLQEWSRDNAYLATRVPWAPLYLLLALKAVYAAFSLVLALLAVFLTRPSQAQEVKERLTVDGLAAAFFEPTANHERAVKRVTDLFHEHNTPYKSPETTKIGLCETEQGGWLWVAARSVINDPVVHAVANAGVDAAAGRTGSVGTVAQGFKLVKEIL